MTVCLNRIKYNNTSKLFQAMEVVVTEDVMGKFVEAKVTVRRPGLSAAVGQIFGVGVFNFDKNEEINGLTLEVGRNPKPPNSIAGKGPARGTWMGQMVAQALQEPGSTTTAPPSQGDTDTKVSPQTFR